MQARPNPTKTLGLKKGQQRLDVFKFLTIVVIECFLSEEYSALSQSKKAIIIKISRSCIVVSQFTDILQNNDLIDEMYDYIKMGEYTRKYGLITLWSLFNWGKNKQKTQINNDMDMDMDMDMNMDMGMELSDGESESDNDIDIDLNDEKVECKDLPGSSVGTIHRLTYHCPLQLMQLSVQLNTL